MTDRRLLAARPDLAAAHLKGKVAAARFAAGEKFMIAKGRASLRAAPSANAARDSELLHGEIFTVYERKDGWAWGQAEKDLYVGYVADSALAAPEQTDTRVTALMTPVFPAPDLKTPPRGLLPLNALVRRGETHGDYVAIAPDAFVHHRHLAPAAQMEPDFTAVAERFVGAPYVWGGKTVAGLDCSGLVQTALQACGINAPRDTDMQERALGLNVDSAQRGDLVFWRGHVGILCDAATLLHANGYHMQTVREPLADAIARIEKSAGPVTAIKRL